MWRTSTRVLQSTAFLLAVLCFVFVRTTSLGAGDGESVVKACGEIFHVCISGSPEVLLESKPDKISRIDSPAGTGIFLKPVNESADQAVLAMLFSKSDRIVSKKPIWLINQALLI